MRVGDGGADKCEHGEERDGVEEGGVREGGAGVLAWGGAAGEEEGEDGGEEAGGEAGAPEGGPERVVVFAAGAGVGGVAGIREREHVERAGAAVAREQRLGQGQRGNRPRRRRDRVGGGMRWRRRQAVLSACESGIEEVGRRGARVCGVRGRGGGGRGGGRGWGWGGGSQIKNLWLCLWGLLMVMAILT